MKTRRCRTIARPLSFINFDAVTGLKPVIVHTSEIPRRRSLPKLGLQETAGKACTAAYGSLGSTDMVESFRVSSPLPLVAKLRMGRAGAFIFHDRK